MSRVDRVSVACVFVAMIMLMSGLAMTVVPQSAQGLTAEVQSPSAPSVAVPGAPQGLTIDQGDGMLWLWWDHPLDQGSELIKWYDIFRGDSPTTTELLYTLSVGTNFYEDWEVVNDQTYYYEISAHSDVGSGPLSEIASGTPTASGTAPSAPQNVATQNNVYSAKVTWTAPSSAGSAPVRYYNVYRGTTPATINYIYPYATVDWKTLEYEDDYAYPGFDYSYTVSAVNIVGEGAASSTTSISVGGTGTIPSAPSYLSTYAGDGGVLLYWGESDNPSMGGVLRYDVFRGASSGGEGSIPIGNVTRSPDGSYWFTYYGDMEVVNDVMYWYFVKAVGTGGSSAPSEEVFAVPSQIGVRPDAPMAIGAYAGNGQILINFAASAYVTGHVVNITGLEIYRSTVSGSPGSLWASITSITGHAWDNTTSNGVTYYYSIRSLWGGGSSEFSPQISATPAATGAIPAAPTNLWTNPQYSSVILDIEGQMSPTPPIVLGYEIYRSTTPGGAGTLVRTIYDYNYPQGDLSWNDHTGTDLITYYYKVKAIGFYGISGLSNEAHAFPSYSGDVPSAPTGLSGSAAGDVVHLTWSFPSYLGTANFIYFDVYVDNGSGEWQYTAGISGYPGDSPSIDDRYMEPGTYYYKVVASNYYGDSLFSNVATVTVTTTSPPSAPIGLAAASRVGVVNLNWFEPASQGSSPIIRYDVYRGTVFGEDGTFIGSSTSVDDTSYQDRSGVLDMEYYYVVKAVNSEGSGPASNQVAGRASAPSAPSAPRNLQVGSHIGSVGLSWEEPSSAGTSAITRYDIFRGTTPGGEGSTPIGNVAGDVLTYTDTTGTPGQSYYYVVKAVNDVGSSPASNEVIGTFIPPQAPTAPRNLVATSGVGYVVLNWQEPSSSGSSTVIRYEIYRHTISTTPVLIGTTAVGVLTYNDTVVSAGTTYYYHVVAVNAEGSGPDSNIVQGTPVVPVGPSAPRNFVGVSGDAYVLLSWDVPTSSGTSAITGYAVFRGTSIGDIGYLVDTTAASVLTYNDTDVTNGVTYYYQVKAMNSELGGALSSVVTANPTGPVPPTAPRELTASGNLTRVILNWTAPESQGTSPILRYEIFRGMSEGSLSLIGEAAAGNLTYTDNTVLSHFDYYYKLRAVSDVGPGPLSNVAVGNTNEPQPPSQPRNLVAEGGNGYVKLEWDLPSSAGTSPIVRYVVFRGTSAGDISTQIGMTVGLEREYNDTTVVNGNTYYYAVKAANTVGPSGPSNTAQATPLGPAVPSAPGNLVAAAGVAKVNLTWSQAVSSTTIIRYDIFRGTSEGSIGTTPIGSVAGTVLAYTDNAVTGGTTYYYKVKATNSVGTGPASVEAHATPTATVPSAPQNVAASPGPGKVTITWAAPSNSGGSAITGYKVYLALLGGAVNIGNVSGSTLSYVDSSGTAGTTYNYYVVAVNGVGAGANSAQVSASPQSASAADNTMLYAGIAIAIIVVIAIVVMLMRRKK